MSAVAAYARRYREDALPSRQQIPPTCDPRWERWCAPLLEFIRQSPRTWEDLRVWEKENSIRPSLLLQMLCWLEFNHRVVAVTEGGPVLWCAARRDPK